MAREPKAPAAPPPRPDPMKRSPATALVAYAQALAMQEPVPDADLLRLIGTVAARRSERAALLTALARLNDKDTRVVVADLLRSQAIECQERAEAHGSADLALGLWLQGLAATLFVFSLGAVLTGNLAGIAGVFAVAGPVCLAGAASAARLRLMRLKGRARRQGDEAATLADAIGTLD